MMSLFIDTSNQKLVVGVIDENKETLVTYYNQILKGEMASKTLDVIKDCIETSRITPNDIEKIYVVTGPGSFTGVRIGVTIAKTFAWALKKKVISISSLEVLASTSCDTKYIVPMIDARREAVFAGIYDNDLNVIFNDSYITLEDLKTKLPEEYTFVSDDEIENYNIVKSDINILKVIKKHQNDIGIDPHHLNPQYLKITEAEANLKKND